MDARLAVFLHVPLGLKLLPLDLIALLDPRFDADPLSPLHHLVSREAIGYFERSPDWHRDSLRVFEESCERGIRWLHIGDPDYPRGWLTLEQPPPIVSYMGEPCWKGRRLLSVVGSRTPSSDSLLWMQRELAPFLRECGVQVVSGGARGVDQWAHRLAIDSRQPTVCILPSGLLNAYPPAAEPLWARILESGGCLMSTCALNEPMRKHFFHVRNRWIAGLSDLCLVVEANRRSGSLLTAKLANDESREVCTLPVSPMSSQGLGNLDLLMSGATMVRDRHDLRTLWNKRGEF